MYCTILQVLEFKKQIFIVVFNLQIPLKKPKHFFLLLQLFHYMLKQKKTYDFKDLCIWPCDIP
jgi:hypothetical protein